MDLGFFLRRGPVLFSWLVLPPGLVAALLLAGGWYSGKMHAHVRDLRAGTQVLPEMQARVDEAETLMGQFFPLDPGNPDHVDQMRQKMQSFAEANGLELQKLSLVPMKEKRQPDGPYTKVHAELNAACDLAGLMNFFNEMNAPEYLVGIETLSYAMVRWGDDTPRYNFKMLLVIHGIPGDAPPAKGKKGKSA